MNKHLLYIFSVSFFYLACAKEAQVDNELIESLLKAEQAQTTTQENFTNGEDTIQQNTSNSDTLESISTQTKDALVNESSSKNDIITNETGIRNNEGFQDLINSDESNPIKEVEELVFSKSTNLINEGRTPSEVKGVSTYQKQILNIEEENKKVESSVKVSKDDLKTSNKYTLNKADANAKLKTTRLKVRSKSDSIQSSSKQATNNSPTITVEKSARKSKKPITTRFKIDTIRLDEVKLFKDLRSSNKKVLLSQSQNRVSTRANNSVRYSKKLSESTENSSRTIKKTEALNQTKKELPKKLIAERKQSKVLKSMSSENEVEANRNIVNEFSRDLLNDMVSNSTTSEIDQIRYRTEMVEPEVTPLFTDPSAHSKRYKKPIKNLNTSRATQISNTQPETKIQEAVIVESLQGFKSDSKSSGAKPDTSTPKVKAINENRITIPDESNTNQLEKNPLIQKSASTYSSTLIPLSKSNKNDFKALINSDLSIRLLKKESVYETNKNYTLLFEIINTGDLINSVSIALELPEFWKIISISDLGTLNTNERKLGVISFYIPTQSPSGFVKSSIQLKTNNYILNSFDFELQVANNYELEVFNVYAPQQVQAGELITSSFGIINKGNVDQEVILSSSNTITGASKIIIPKDSTVIVELQQKTNPKANALRKISTNLQVYNTASQRKFYNTQSIEVIPTKIKQKDPYLRYPVQASLYFSSYTKENDHYSTMSAELRGNGYVDTKKDHHLNFIIRAPKKANLRRFSIVDQYSFIYRYKNRTVLHLGDHSYFINKLGFGSRYGMGFKIDHNIKKWTLSAFYSRPRLYSFNKKPLYGVRAVYHKSDSLNIGLTLERSHGNSYFYRNSLTQDGKGQILTLDYDFTNNNTRVEAEVSTSFNNNTIDFATDLNFVQNFKNFAFSSYVILSGKNYLGNISNSLQVANNLYYNNKGLNFGIGHAVSRVNRRLDPILFETEPYYEAYFATLGYRFSNKHYFNLRIDKRVREDQLEPKNYHYNEYGVSYNFNYFNKLFTGSFGGRLAKTQNLLTELKNYRTTYSNHLNVTYKIFKGFQLRGGLNFLYTNRYGLTNETTNYLRYSIGFNYNLMRRLSLNMNYNSGYSPEETYKRREYINLNIRANINKHHRLEIRANYFENPAVVNNKELFAYAKYTYSFGLGLKRLFDQGGIQGQVFTKYNDIDIKGVKLYTAGKTITTDKYGGFELNNLELGTNYIYIDEASLPLNVVSTLKNPIEVVVDKDKKATLDLELVKSGSLIGDLALKNKELAIETNLESYLKLENDNFTYYAESRSNGTFKFQNIVPGDYTFTLIRFKNNGKTFSLIKETEVTVKEEINTELKVTVKGKERKIKFKDTNLKIGYND